MGILVHLVIRFQGRNHGFIGRLLQYTSIGVAVGILIQDLELLIGDVIPIDSGENRPGDVFDEALFPTLIHGSHIGKDLEEDVEVIRVDLDIVDDGVLEHHNILGRILHRVNHKILGPLVILGLQLDLQITGRDKEVGDVSVHPLMV